MPDRPEDSRRKCWLFGSFWTSLFMALCLRKVDHKRDWDDPRSDESWLGANDLRADALQDLATSENKLSIWEIGEQVPVDRILAALGATRDNVNKLDYILFEFSVLEEFEMPYERVPGKTPDAAVNECHLDLIRLTARKLSDFGARIRSAGKAQRCMDRRLRTLIQQAVDASYFDRALLKPGIIAHIRKAS